MAGMLLRQLVGTRSRILQLGMTMRHMNFGIATGSIKVGVSSRCLNVGETGDRDYHSSLSARVCTFLQWGEEGLVHEVCQE